MGRFKWLVLVGLMSIFIAILWSGRKEDTWIGIFYPDKNNLLIDERSPELKNLEECRTWAAVKKYKSPDTSSRTSDYECCKNGRYKVEVDMYVCEETTR